MSEYVAERAGRGSVPFLLLALLLVCVLGAGGLVPIGPEATVDLPVDPISTKHDDADWVPFIGNGELWCVQGNPGFAGCASHHNRPAVDIGMRVGTRIRAAGSGRVVEARNVGDGRGTYVVIRHPDGVRSRYYHLRSESVRVGQRVFRGKVIGRSGRSGAASAPHLHYEEVGKNGRTKEPGVMFGHRGSRVVRYPTAWGTSKWRRARYGGRMVNDGYPPFKDVDPTMKVYAAVRWAADERIVTRKPSGTFRPRRQIGRAQSLAWLWKGLGRPTPLGQAEYPDVPPGASYQTALNWAAGVPTMLDPFVGEFLPDQPLTRIELARLLWAAAGRPAAPSVRTFTDVDEPAVDWVVARGFMDGVGAGTFRPNRALTRGQTIRVVHQARPFSDVALDGRIGPAVEWARWRGYVSGLANHEFRPKTRTRRGGAIAVVWRSQGSVPAAPAPFVDTAGQRYRVAADWAYEHGVSMGFPTPKGRKYRGSDVQTRGSWLLVLWRLHDSPRVDHDHPWSDLPAKFDAAADWAHLHGVIRGYRDGTFRRTKSVTRGQAVSSLHRSLFIEG